MASSAPTGTSSAEPAIFDKIYIDRDGITDDDIREPFRPLITVHRSASQDLIQRSGTARSTTAGRTKAASELAACSYDPGSTSALPATALLDGGSNKTVKVDLVRAYSNPPDHVERLRSLLDLPQAARPKRPEHPPKQAQIRLNHAGVARLVAAYTAGGRVKKLATQFGIHRETVHNILEREGVLRLPGLQPEALPAAVRLYEEGWSLARLAIEFDVSPTTVNRALRKAGVSMRLPGRRPAVR